MTTPLHYIFQAAMGQCSTLPTENNGKQEAAPTQMTPSSHSSRRSYRQQREERDTYGRDVDEGRRQSDGDVVMGDAYASPRSASRRDVDHMMNVAKDANAKYDKFMEDATSHSYHSARSSRSSANRPSSRSRAREAFVPLPSPPEGSVLTKCYRLNLDVGPATLSPTHDSLGPFDYRVPPHLKDTTNKTSRGFPAILSQMSDESIEKSDTQIAIDTALIFRGIKVDSKGNITGRNDRASRSRRSQNTSKTAENSRQSAKINKANDLVDEMAGGNGKENDGEKPNMIAVYPVGEYDDMKQLVRDGAKKLREAESKGDEWIMSLNRSRGSTNSTNSLRLEKMDFPTSPSSSSSRRRMSSSPYQDASTTPSSSSSSRRSRSRGRITNSSVPPKLKSHPRDRPSSRRMDKDQKCSNSLFGGGQGSDWSDALNFNSLWTCGTVGNTVSPSNHDSPATARSPRYERRNESSTRYSRGASERDAPMMR